MARALLRSQADHPYWGEHVRGLLRGGRFTPPRGGGGVDAGDHPPITPLKAATERDVRPPVINSPLTRLRGSMSMRA